MSDYLVPFLIFVVFLGIGWLIRRRLVSTPKRGREYRAMLDILEDAVLVFNANGRPLYLNQTARKWFGINKAESYDLQQLCDRISPTGDFIALLSKSRRASLQIGRRSVEATSQQIDIEGVSQITVVLHDTTISQALLAKERRRTRERTMFDELTGMNILSAVINASLNAEELWEIIVYSVIQTIECDRAALFIMDNERGVLNLAKSRGLSKEFIRRSQNLAPALDGRAQVVLDRYPLVVNDIRRASGMAQFVPISREEGFVAFADFPLRGREHVLGVLTVYYDQPHNFDESELKLLTTLANQVTLALENARLYERTDQALARRVEQLAAIEEIGRELSSTLDLGRIFDLVLQRAMGSTGASAGLLALSQSDSNELELIIDYGYQPEAVQPYQDEGWPISHGIIGHVARTGETAIVNAVTSHPDYVTLIETTCAQLTVPIIKEAHVLGVISLESSRPQGFSPDDVRFTTQLAELAVIAIENARLFHQVRQGRDNLQAILDSTYEGILVIGQDARIVLANPMIEEMSGLSAQELIGRRASAVVDELGHRAATLLGYPTNEIQQVLDLLESMSDTISKRTYEIPGSSPRHIEQIASPVVDKDGEVVGRLIVLRDITEERRLARMRQDLTDMIIHDLRSPLTAVVGGVQFADDLLDTEANPAMIHRALNVANESSNRLMALVDSLLDISRLEAGQMPLKREPVSLSQLAQSVIEQMSLLAEQDMVTLQLQATSQTPPVDADPELIRRVLVNLVDNALKHSPHNSTVTIRIFLESAEREQSHLERTEAAVSSTESPSQTVRCAVLDMGKGIPVEHRETVFDRFSQLDGRRRGTGLGLTFCRLTVQAHSGRIWMEDNPQGQGSAFIFTLPVVPPEMVSSASLDATEEVVPQ